MLSAFGFVPAVSNDDGFTLGSLRLTVLPTSIRVWEEALRISSSRVCEVSAFRITISPSGQGLALRVLRSNYEPTSSP